MARLQELAVLVTGCSSGIGRALAVAFAEEGHRVAATARRPESLASLEGVAARLALDVSSGDSIARGVHDAVEAIGGLDVVVNNAGFGLFGPAVELDLARFRLQLETNVVGALAVVQAALPALLASGRGRIVTIGSVSGVTTTPFAGAYCASKAALHALDEALRMELEPFGIHVLTVQPGAVSSSFADTAAQGLDVFRDASSSYAAVADAIVARAKASQRGAMDAADLARAVVRAASAERPPVRLRLGKWSRLLPAIGSLPARLRHRLLARQSGLSRLARRRPR